MANKLKPCPFCGGEAEVHGGQFYWVQCKNCKAETHGSKPKGAVIRLWNTRVHDDLIERLIDDGK
jgi:Lar family restriction alleviation protein